jgi:hypothetical protein
MANWFVRSLATGTGAGTSWTNATTTIAAAITLGAAGDTYFIADDHAETSTSTITLTFKGTVTAPDTVLCADHLVTTPTSTDLKTTGQVTTTGTAAAITLKGFFYLYGVTFTCGTGASTQFIQLGNAGNYRQTFEACLFVLPGSSNAAVNINASGLGIVRWVNSKVNFAVVGMGINIQNGSFEWVNTATAIQGSTFPTTLLQLVSPGHCRLEGVDLSALGSGKTIAGLVNIPTANSLLKDCKLGASVTIVSNQTNQFSGRFDVIRCDSGNTNYRNESYMLTGTQTTETTIVRTGGATDGTTGFSHKIVTNADAVKLQPYELLPIAIWNDTVGSSQTITVEAIASAVLNNDECWMEVEYLGDASFPIGSLASTYKTNILATGAANTTSTATWGGALTGKFKMAVTITPQQKGPITVYVKVAKASTTVYIDPFITVT